MRYSRILAAVALVAAVPGFGQLTTFASRPAFNAAAPGLPTETFENGLVAPGGVVACPAPLAGSGNPCFSAAGILPGVSISNGGVDRGGSELALAGAGFSGLPTTSKIVVANFFADPLHLDFPFGQGAVGFDLISAFFASNISVDVFGSGGLLGNFVVAATPGGVFFGVTSTTPIVRITLSSATNQAEGVDNLSFASGCPTHVHGHSFLFGHGNRASHGFGHTAGDPRHGHHFVCPTHLPGHLPFGLPLQPPASPGGGSLTGTRPPSPLTADPVSPGLEPARRRIVRPLPGPEAGEEPENIGFVAALNQDGSRNGATAARRGTVLQLFGSAAGLFIGDEDTPGIRFTAPASGNPVFTTTEPEVRIGGVLARVLFSGMAPGLTGVWQLNVLIPEGTPSGNAKVAVLHDEREVRSLEVAIE